MDELWCSHIRRFQWYLDFKGASLPIDFYSQVEEDLKKGLVFCFEVEEQDDGITPKKEDFAKSVLSAKARAIARPMPFEPPVISAVFPLREKSTDVIMKPLCP